MDKSKCRLKRFVLLKFHAMSSANRSEKIVSLVSLKKASQISLTMVPKMRWILSSKSSIKDQIVIFKELRFLWESTATGMILTPPKSWTMKDQQHLVSLKLASSITAQCEVNPIRHSKGSILEWFYRSSSAIWIPSATRQLHHLL